MHRLTLAALALMFGLAGPSLSQAADWSNLPDWGGQWIAIPSKPAPPAYKPDWAKKRAKLLADVKSGKEPDPGKVCGLPVGNPWMLSVPDVHQWIVNPQGAWHFVENGGFVSRISTTQDHLGPNDIFPTYTGDSTGKWEGQTLVVDTIGLRDDTWLGPGALIHSDQTRLTERIRQTGANALELDLTVDDPVAFTRPWHVVQRYRRLPKGGFTHDWACKVVRNAKG